MTSFHCACVLELTNWLTCISIWYLSGTSLIAKNHTLHENFTAVYYFIALPLLMDYMFNICK